MGINIDNSFVPNTKVFDNIKLSTDDNATDKAGAVTGSSFLDVLKSKVDDVNQKQIDSENITEQYIKGADVDVHQVMLSGEEAKMSLELAVQVRNKLIDAYQELNRTQM